LEAALSIDWSNTIPYNPEFGPGLVGWPKGGIQIPAYGKYGGPQISGNGFKDDPVDKLDALFKAHDQAIDTAMEDGLVPSELVQPHGALINGITGLKESDDGLLVVVKETAGKPPEGDAEATLYAGMTSFALTAELTQLGFLGQLEGALDRSDPFVLDDVQAAIKDAARYMEKGLEEVPAEGRGLDGALQLFEKQFVELLGTPDLSHSSGALDFLL
jgi:hypothetical protein